MAGQYEVFTEALTEHARKVDGFTDRVVQAVDAARQVSLPSDAYGQCCWMLPAMLNPLGNRAAAALDSGATRLATTAASVRDAAKDYAAVDAGNAQALQRTRGLA